jgi:hypothetical protein
MCAHHKTEHRGNPFKLCGVEHRMRSLIFTKLGAAAATIALFIVAADARNAFAQASASAKAAAPTADQIIDRYIAAIGGRALVGKFTSRASLGTIEVPAMNVSGTVMIHEKAPDKILQVVVIGGNALRQAFDGKTAWSDDPADGMRLLSGVQLAEAKRDADFYHALHLHQIYSSIVYTGAEKISGREVYVLIGITSDEPSPDKMYFDAQNGLILRVISHRHTPDGEADVQEDFEDYRSIDGMQIPFTILQSGGSSNFTIRITQVRNGADLDDGEFAPPQDQKSTVE